MVNPTLSHHNNSFFSSPPPTPFNPFPTQRTNTNTHRGRRIFLALISLGLSELARLALKAYRARHASNDNHPQVYQAEIARHNLRLIDNQLDPNRAPMVSTIKEEAIANTKQFFKDIAIPDPRDLVDKTLHDLRSQVTSCPKLSENAFKDLVYSKLKRTVLINHITNQVISQTPSTSDNDPNSVMEYILTKFNTEIEILMDTPAAMLKGDLENLIQLMITSTRNTLVQKKVIDNCIQTGLKAVLNALYATPKEAMDLPRNQILTLLYAEAQKLEKCIYQKNENKPVDISSAFYEESLTKIADKYYGTIIQTGLLTDTVTKNSHDTLMLLQKAMQVTSDNNLQTLIEKITCQPKDVNSIQKVAIELYRKTLAGAQNAFGDNRWHALTSNHKNLFLSIVYALLKFENPSLKDITTRDYLLKLAKELDNQGLKITRELSETKNESSITSLIVQSSYVSGTLVMVLNFIGGKGYGLE